MRSIEEIKKQFPEREEQKKSNGSETKSFIGISPVQAAFSAYKKAAVQIEEEERRKRRATLTAIPDPTEKKKTYAEMLKESNAAAQKMEGEIPSYYKPKTSVQEIKNLIFGKPKAGGTANPTISAAEMNTRFDEMTEEQARAYSYYKNAGKAKEAKDYLKAIEPDINARAAAKRTEEAKALAEESTTGGLYARYMAGLTNPMGVIYGQMQNAQGEAIDPNSPYLIGQQIQEGQHAGFIGESTGAKRFAKEAAMGVFDFGTQAATLGGMGLSGKALGNATSALYGATAFSGNIKDAAERGATTGEAITYGTIGAAAEIITERLGFERLFRLGGIAANGAAMRRAIKAILPNMAAEGAEESLTEATNLVSDVFIMGDRSQMHRIYSEAKAAGMTEGEAAREAITAGLKQIGYAGAVGAASGGVIAGGVAGLSRAAGRNMLDGNTEENVENSVEDGENLLNAAENNTQEGENGTNLPESGANQQENGTNIPESGTNQQGRGTNADRATASAEYGERWFYEEGQRLLAEEEQRRGNVSFLPAFQTYYAAGLAGIAESEIRQTAETSAADRGLLTAAYMAGSRDRAADISARLKGTGKLGQTKGVFLETEAATEAQKAFAKLIAETSGAEVILVDHLENNANGLYRRGRGQIVIALDAESFTGTLAHESLHYIRETNSEGYARAQEAVFRMAAALEGKTTEDYISQYKRRYEGHVDTIGEVMEEMTADAFQRIAADEEGLRGLLREMEQSEPGILEKLKEFIDKLLETLEGLLDDQRFSEFADDIHKNAENTRKLQRIFAEEMKRSGEMQEGKAEARISESEANENHSYLPEGETAEVEEVAFSFAGRRARNANITAKEKAEKMEAAGRSKEEIFHDTGWFRGADGEWRFEIDDSGFRFFPNGDANFANNENYQRYRKMWKEADFENKDFPMLDEIYGAELGREKKLLGFYIQHKALFENYPHLQHATFRYEEMQDGRRAYYNPEGNEIVLDKGMQSEYTLEPAKMSVLHEIQHAIQNFEGFSRGTSLTEMSKTYGAENAYHSYRNAAGEIEARDTEARRNLTEEERREKFPDIGNEKTIFVETTGEKFSLRENKEINYESLTAKPDMKKTRLDSHAMEGKTKRDILAIARESARRRKHPKNTDTALFIRNMDTRKDILVAKKGIEHSLQRKWQETGIMLSGLGEMLENAVKINELEPREGVESAYILMGYGEDEKGSGYPAYFVINEYANGNIEMERVGTLYAANAKKIEPAVNTAMDAGRNALLKSGSTISIEELLEKVNGIYSDILPRDVAEKFRHGRRETKLGKDVKFSMREQVEETKDLIAVHNLKAEDLESALQIGGFPMPSIAIVKDNMGHEKYGEISVIFGKDSIAPEADKRNVVYGGDAWTPTVPRVDYQVDNKTKRQFEDRIEELSKSVAEGVFQRGSVLSSLGIDDSTNMSLEDISRKAAQNNAVQAAYLAEKGENITPIWEKKNFDSFGNNSLQYFIDSMGTERLEQLKETLDAWEDLDDAELFEVKGAIRKGLLERSNFMNTPEKIEKRLERLKPERAAEFARNALHYQEEGDTNSEKIDYYATADAMREKASQKDVENWVRSQLEGLLGKAGVYNGKDPFTSSGNRRSFQQLHYAYTLENLVKAMSETQEEQGEGIWGLTASGLQGVATRKYSSIAEIKTDKGRLSRVDSAEYEAIKDGIDKKIEEIISEVKAENKPHSDNSFNESDIIGSVIVEAARGRKTTSAIRKAFSKNAYQISEKTAKDILSTLKAAAEMPTEYFEAKPKRAIGLDEILTVVLPAGTDGKLRKRLEENGLSVTEYEAGNSESRLKAINSVQDAKFSIREEEYQRILAENERLAEANAALKRQFTITRDALHDPESARKAGRNFLKRYDSGFSLDEFTERFTGLCDYIAQSGDRVDAKKVMSALQKLAYEVISESRVLNKEASEEYRDLKNDLRKTKIKVTEDMVKEFDYYGGYNETRMRNFGKIGLSRQGGIAADTLYAELAERYPELFQEDFTGSEVDMIMDIIAVADSLDPVYENPYAMDMDEAALEASYELWDMYFDIQMQKPTFADRYEKKLEKERAKAKAARHYLREEIKERYEKKLEEAKKTELARLMGEGRKTAKEIAKLRRELAEEKENVRERDEKISELKEWEALWAAAYREARREDKAAAKAEMKEKLKEEHLAALIHEGKKLEELRRKKDAQLERQAESHRRAMERQDERYERLKERQAAQREREEYRKMRRGVEKNVKALLKWIDTPTDTYHLPENMLAGVKEFLLKLDTSDDEITLKQEDFRRAQEAIKKLKPDEDGNADFYIEYDEQIEEMLQYLIDMFPQTGKNQVRLADLTAAEMRDLRDITNSMKRAIMDANRFISMGRNASISSIAESYIQETEKRKAARQAGTIRQISDFFNLDMMDAPSFFKSMGTGIYNTIYKGFREGFNQKINHVEEARAKMAEIADEKTIRRWRKAGAKEFTVQTADGKEVRIYLTIPQIMSLYCLTRRRQGKNHLDTGGFTIEQDKYGRKIMREEWQETLEQEETPEKKAERRKAWEAAQKAAKRRGKDAARQYEAVQTSAAEIARITETLTAEQKEAAEAIQEYLSSDVARWGNETSMLLYGYRKFTERHYFPIEGDKDFINAEYGADKKKRTLARMGITRHIIREAKNPLILKDIFSVYAKHIDQMTSYNAFVPVLSDLNKLLNYKILPSGEGVQQIQSMRKSITRVMGPKGINYISNLMDRINGAANGDDTAALPKMFLRNMKIASVGANARVIIQQPVSYLRAADVISPKYLFAAFGAGKNDFQRIYQYAPIARWKDWGNYEMNIGRSIEEMMAGQSYFQKFMEFTMWGAGKADKVTWGRIWKAVELETKKKQPELAPDSDRFYRAVGERFTEIIDETQVVDSILHRSQLMRSKSMFNQMATSFMSEPTKTYNMFRNSLVNFYAERTPENGKRMMRTFLTLTANGIGVAILAGFVDAVRDDEDDDFFEKWRRAVVGDYKDAETPKEKLLAALGSNLNDNFNPMNYIPFLRDLLSAVQGYDVKRTDFSWAADILKNAQEWDKFMKGESRYTFSAMLLETAGSISKLTGIPINSAKRDIFAIKDSFINHILGPDIQYENEKLKYFIGSERNTADYVKRMLEAKLDGNEELATKVYNDMIKAGISAETMENQLDSREKDRLRKEAEAEAAADAFWKEDFSDYMNQRDALGEKGYKEDNIESVIREITKKKYGEEAAETFDEISSDFWSKEEKAEKKDFQMTIDGMIEAKLAGKKEEATRLYNYMVGKGISNEKLDNAIESGEKKRVQEEPLAKEGAEAFHEGDIDRYTDIIDRLHEKGYFRGNAEKGVKTLYNKIYKGEEEEGFEEIKGDYWEEELEPDEMDYEMMANAYLYGDISDYNEAWAALEAQGKKKVNGGKTSMKSRMKKAYHEAKASGDYKKAEKARKEYLRLGGKAEKLLEQG